MAENDQVENKGSKVAEPLPSEMTRESSPSAAEGATPQVPKPIGGTVVSSKEWAERIISGLWNTGSNYEDFVREVAKALDSVRVAIPNLTPTE